MLDTDVTPSHLGVKKGENILHDTHLRQWIKWCYSRLSTNNNSHMPSIHSQLNSLIWYGAFIYLGTSFIHFILSDNLNTWGMKMVIMGWIGYWITLLWSYAFCLVSPWWLLSFSSQVLSCLSKVVQLGGLNGGNVSISFNINDTFHLLPIRCPFYWAGCYMYPKKVRASSSHEKKGPENLRLMKLYKKWYWNLKEKEDQFKMRGKETNKKRRLLKPKKKKKHELYPLAKRPSPQVLCNECIPNKRT